MSDEIERAAEIYANRILHTLAEADSMVRAFKAGAQWQAERALKKLDEAKAEIERLRVLEDIVDSTKKVLIAYEDVPVECPGSPHERYLAFLQLRLIEEALRGEGEG